MSIQLKPCPYCGAEAVIKTAECNFQIVGCSGKEFESMLCPRPSMVVYKGGDGDFDYTYWNRRTTPDRPVTGITKDKL